MTARSNAEEPDVTRFVASFLFCASFTATAGASDPRPGRAIRQFQSPQPGRPTRVRQEHFLRLNGLAPNTEIPPVHEHLIEWIGGPAAPINRMFGGWRS